MWCVLSVSAFIGLCFANICHVVCCRKLQFAATRCYVLQPVAKCCNLLQPMKSKVNLLQSAESNLQPICTAF